MGYRTLLEILTEQAAERERAETAQPESCPDDGVPLTETEQGRHCRFCGRVFP